MRSFIQLGKLNVTAHSIRYHLLLSAPWWCVPFFQCQKTHWNTPSTQKHAHGSIADTFRCVCEWALLCVCVYFLVYNSYACRNAITMANSQCLHHSLFVFLLRFWQNVVFFYFNSLLFINIVVVFFVVFSFNKSTYSSNECNVTQILVNSF